MPSFIEFFCGGGCARIGLGDAWKCLFANDISPQKVASYRANFGASEVRLQDIRELSSSDLPKADLWWASFPCQDHSAAGNRAGFTGVRGALVFEVMRLLDAATASGTAPRLIVMENVTGFLNAFDSRDFASVATALVSAGYRIGSVMMDARHFLPQSRERMMLVAVREDAAQPGGLAGDEPSEFWHTKALRRAASRLPAEVSRRWAWWQMPLPPEHGLRVEDMLDSAGEAAGKWLAPAKLAELLLTVTGRDAERLEKAKQSGRRVTATIVNKRKDAPEGYVRGIAIRVDGIAGCLLCRAKSTRQRLMVIDGEDVAVRNFSPRELARLMGLPVNYRLPKAESAAIRLTGDGLVVPVVRYLAANLLEPLLAAGGQRPRTTAVAEPRIRAVRQRKDPVAHGAPIAGGIKKHTVATTAYFLPDEAARLHVVAAEMGVSLHELVIIALDSLLARRGAQPVRRYISGR